LAKPFMDTGNTRLRIKKDRLEKRHRAFFITPSLYFGGYEFVVRFCLGQQIMRLICIKSERIYVPLRNWVENKPYSHLMIKPFIVNNILTENSDRTLSNPKTMKSTCQSPLPSWSQTASLSPDGSIDAARIAAPADAARQRSMAGCLTSGVAGFSVRFGKSGLTRSVTNWRSRPERTGAVRFESPVSSCDRSGLSGSSPTVRQRRPSRRFCPRYFSTLPGCVLFPCPSA